ncbi:MULTISPECIES: hypothetical protein [unclassified Leeuwenhoekiella]|uniref:hypothetical protein n=1 Tax=unclassified Leeuwenhoekiella TaxID=2615029 RepID=UPI000C553796|nr:MULTISPECIES: hypothetical protein [unclassified Leeuwenhoekiella]MAW95992.1 hypothetical protein [Leeuwenhoekiella sp.]
MRLLFFISVILLSISANAQRSTKIYNRIGIQGVYTLTTLHTNNLNTIQSDGFQAGLSTRGAFYNNFDLIYGIDFLQTGVEIQGREEVIPYTLSGVQVKLLASYLIAGENLSLEFGPILQVNGGLKLDDQNQENQILEGYTLLNAGDLEEISRVNGMLTAGITGGLEWLRLTAAYQYNFTNILNKFNSEDLNLKDPAATNFKGNLGLITAGIVIYL